MSNDQFAEIIAGHFYDVLRAAGVSMSPVNAHEKIRTVSKKLALSIEHRAEQQAIVVIKRLQTAVNKAFDSMETDFKDQKERITRLEEIVMYQTKLIDALHSAVTFRDPEAVSAEFSLEDLKIRVEEHPAPPAPCEDPTCCDQIEPEDNENLA